MSKKPIKKLADLAKEALDMSKEARMARAEKMGFVPQDVFHATRGNIAEFSAERAGQNYGNPAKGFFFTDNPRAAASFLDESYLKVEVPKPGTIAKELADLEDLVTKKNLTVTKLVDPSFGFPSEVKKEGLNAADSALADRYFELKRIKDATPWEEWRKLNDVMETAPNANMLKTRLRYENPKVIDLTGKGDINVHPFIEKAKADGHDAVILKGAADNTSKSTYGRHEAGQTVVVFDPSQIRSVNAKFDPKKKGSGNILDSLGPIAVGAAGVGVASQDAEAKPISPSQLKKAAAAGYDAENILYHGSINKGVQEFVIDGSHSNFGQKAGPGTYLTPEKWYAEQYTQDNSGKTIGEVRKLVLPKGAVLDEYSNPGSLEKFYKDHGLNLKDLEFATKYTFDPSWAVWRGVRQKFPNLDEADQIKKMQGMLEKSGYAAVAREGDAGVEYVVQRPQVLRDIEKAAFKDNKSANILAGGAGAATLAASNDALAADLNSPVASGMGEVASQAGHAMERFDAYTSNPFRKFLNSALEGKGIIQSAREGVAAIGAEKPTTGEEVAKNFLSLSPNQNLGFPTADGGKDYPLAGPLGVAVDFAVDPTNIPMAKAVGPSMDAASSISRIIEQSLLKRGLVLP